MKRNIIIALRASILSHRLIIIFIIVALAVGGGAFYAGMKYGQSNPSFGAGRGLSQTDFQNLRNLSPEERQQRLQELGANAGAGFRAGRAGGGFANGEIIAKDEKTLTIKLPDGGSKIIFYSDTSEVGKFVKGVSSDLEVGANITVTGIANSDGSITAKSIQIRPQPQN